MRQTLALMLLLIAAPTFAASIKDTIYGQATVSEVTSIYDADTFRVNIADWPEVVGYRIPIRVVGVDAPEIRGKCEQEKVRARAAKQFTVAALRGARSIELRNIKRGKYFRLLAEVWVDGRNLSDELIRAGHARPYDGGTRAGWCETDPEGGR
ncbi:MAG: thermonuclease family protein [Gammaproteobacteria bacterium]